MRSFLVALMLLSVTGCDNSGQLTSLTGTVGATGTVCAAAGRDGLAFFAWETITNNSDQRVVVDKVRLSGAELDVVEWFLADRDWEEGVGSGPLPDSDGHRLSNEVPANGQVLLAMTVRATNPPSPRGSVEVGYSSGDRTGVATLSWQVLVGAPNEQCDPEF